VTRRIALLVNPTSGKGRGARLLEPVGMLNIRFGFGLGKGTSIAPSWVKVAA